MFLGIDVGTSAVKVCLAGRDLRPLESASAPLSISHPEPRWSEQNPEDWWTATVEAVRAVTDRVKGSAGGIAGIGLSGQMHGAVLLDASHKVVRPAILWNDGRSDAQCAAIAERGDHLAQLAGARPMAGFTAPKIMWLRQQEPENLVRIERVLLPKDYLGFRLHGAFMTDPSDAAGTYWFDQKARRWSRELCDVTSTDIDWLPRVAEGVEAAGALTTKAASALGLRSGIPVAVGGGDAAAGAVAVGAVRDGAGFVSLGTSGQLFIAASAYRAAPEAGIHSYAHCVPDMWFQMAAMLNGARPLSWFSEMTGASIALLLAEAEAAPLSSTPLFLPYLTGERTPHADNLIRGGFYGLENDTTRGQMTRAVVEAIAYSFADAKAAVGAVVDIPGSLLAIGGGSKSDFLLQTIADVLDAPIRRAEGSDMGPSMGAARLGAVAAGGASIDDISRPPAASTEFCPDLSARTRHLERLESYRGLYLALRTIREAPTRS